MKLLKRLGDIHDAAEIAIPVLLGTVLFFGLYIGVPFAVGSALLRESKPWGAATVAVLTTLLAGANIRDAVRRRWSWISVGSAVIWVLCVGYMTILLHWE